MKDKYKELDNIFSKENKWKDEDDIPMKRYTVTIPEQELIVEAEDEGDAESQALGLWDWGNVDMDVEEDE